MSCYRQLPQERTCLRVESESNHDVFYFWYGIFEVFEILKKWWWGGGGKRRTRSFRIFQIILFKMESATFKNHSYFLKGSQLQKRSQKS